MKQWKEEQIQERAEKPATPAEGAEWSAAERAEIDVYRLLYKALSEEPEWTLSADFAERVTGRAFSRREPLWGWMLAPVALFSAAFGTLLALPSAAAIVATGIRTSIAPLSAAPVPLLTVAALTVAATMLADRLLSRNRSLPA